jgi:hypothetical protein
MFPAPPPTSEAPPDYAAWLAALKARIHQERLRVVLASNAAMMRLYWDIGHSILDKQSAQGWGSRVIDRLATDLREAFPEMKGFSPRNLKYMRAFAAAWPDLGIVQRSVAQLSWRHNLTLLEKLPALTIGFGMPRKRSGTAGHTTSWLSKSKPRPTGGRAKHRPTSWPHCRHRIQTWQRKFSGNAFQTKGCFLVWRHSLDLSKGHVGP